MAIIILNHKVADYERWKVYYDNDAKRRTEAGLRELKVGGEAADPNNVYMIFETQDPSTFEKMANDPGLQEIMKKSGVVSDPVVVILP